MHPTAQHEPGPLSIAVSSLLGGCVLWAPALLRPSLTGYGDWQYFHHMWEAGRVSLERFGEAPLWDPFHCGGVTLWGNPQAQVYSPLFLLALLLGTTAATKAFVVLHTAAGLAGMYVFGRREVQLPAASSALAAIAWGYSGFFAWHGGGGHAAFFPFYFIPWLLLAWRMAIRTSPRWGVAAAAIIALSVLEGAVYPVAFFALLLSFDAVVMAHRHGTRPVLWAAAVIVPLSGLLAAVRLWPIALTLLRYPRPDLASDRLLPVDVLEMFLAPTHPWQDPSHTFRWGEYGAYFGFIATALAVAGAIRAWQHRDQRHLLAGVLLFGSLMIGDWGSLSPYALLNELPIFRALRVPSRFSVLVLFFMALLAGHGAAWLAHFVRARLDARRPRLAAMFPALLALTVAVELLAVNLQPIGWWRMGPIRTGARVERFHLTRSERYQYEYASYPHRNVGTDICYDAIVWPVSNALWIGDQDQARVVGGAGRVLESGRTPRTAWAHVDLQAPGRVVFNANFAPGWRARQGTLVDDKGRLAVDIEAGDHRIEVRYEPEERMPSLMLSGLGILAGGLIVGARRRRRPVAGRPGRHRNSPHDIHV
jgi:hypothetical protein